MTQQKTTIARKYITIPEYKPLFAMAKCFGPTKGPLEKPTPATLPVIEALLKQTGRDAVTILETVRRPDGKGWMPKVQLTLDNYNLPYADIVAGKTNPAIKKETVDLESKPVGPAPVQLKKSTIPIGKKTVRELDDTVQVADRGQKVNMEIVVPAPVKAAAVETPADKIPEPEPLLNPDMVTNTMDEQIKADLEPAGEVVEDVVKNATEVLQEETDAAIEESTEETPTGDTKHLTKAERKELRRAQRKAEANNQ